MTNQDAKKRIVTDEFGQTFELIKKLGQGGQGIVCSTQFDKVIVKMTTKKDLEKKKKWFEHIRWLMRQPLEQLSIAQPFSRIEDADKGHFGYAMELMDGLVPLQSLMDTTEQAMVDSAGSPGEYLASGGIKRRIQLLAKLARILANLHCRGLAYGDLSPANVFVSKNIEDAEVWLIDCDNICVNQRESFDSALIEGKAGRVFSPGYGAPEVVSGDSYVSSLTDSWSFAVIAMKLLTTNHPFVGEFVDAGTPEDEENAFAGKLPWIHHPDDKSNELGRANPKGIDIDEVADQLLKRLFDSCFNKGKNTPLLRPSLSEWAEVLEKISHLQVYCRDNHCNASFYFLRKKEKLTCPFCGSEANNQHVLYIRTYLKDETIKDLPLPDEDKKSIRIDTGNAQTLNLGETLIIKNSPPGSVYWSESAALISISFNKTGLNITPLGAKSFTIQHGKNKKQTFSLSTDLSIIERDNTPLSITPVLSSETPRISYSYKLKW
jgi:serine/threonine protein kinase